MAKIYYHFLRVIIVGDDKLKVFNPKSCGLFGQLDIQGGGLILPGLREHSLAPPKFISEQQTEFHMKAEVFS